MTLHDLCALFSEAMKSNKLAQLQLNDVLEENQIERLIWEKEVSIYYVIYGIDHIPLPHEIDEKHFAHKTFNSEREAQAFLDGLEVFYISCMDELTLFTGRSRGAVKIDIEEYWEDTEEDDDWTEDDNTQESE